MTPTPDDENSSVKDALVRLEAKIDVMLGRHEARIEDLTRRQGETTSTLREHDARITANALTIAETRSATANVQAELNKRGNAVVSWVAVGVAALAVVIDPILQTLLSKN